MMRKIQLVGRSNNSAPREMIKEVFGVCLVSIMGEHQRDYKTFLDQTMAMELAELSLKAGLVVRVPDSAAVKALFELEEYDYQERSETFDFLKRAMNETRFVARRRICFRGLIGLYASDRKIWFARILLLTTK